MKQATEPHSVDSAFDLKSVRTVLGPLLLGSLVSAAAWLVIAMSGALILDVTLKVAFAYRFYARIGPCWSEEKTFPRVQ
jgi:hypothetical protein